MTGNSIAYSIALASAVLIGTPAFAQSSTKPKTSGASGKDDRRAHLGKVADRTVTDCAELRWCNAAGQQVDADRRVTQRHCVRRPSGALSWAPTHYKPTR